MATILRQCERADYPGMWAVRYAVTENTLTPGRLNDEHMRIETEVSGRGWVVEVDGRIEAFAVGNAQTGNIWALFVHPDAEGRGYGQQLMSVMSEWLWSQGLQRLSLSTDPDSRGADFYRRNGWTALGLNQHGELCFEKNAPDAAP